MKRTNCGPAAIDRVEQGSAAEAAGLKAGDSIIKIDGLPLRDVLDLYMGLAGEGGALLEIRRGDTLSEVRIDLQGSPPGIEVSEPVFGSIATCDNNCMFCFVDQLPGGLRPSLYVKDDDYRLSFLGGNFITLTNLNRADVRRITTERLSPLYVSLHSTETVVRKKMFGNPEADRSLKVLREVLRAGIDVHLQIVVVRGVNDSEHLDHTLRDIREEFPRVKSVGVVPVGLSTGGKKTLADKYGFDRDSSAELIEQVNAWRRRFGRILLAAADEFYFMAGAEPPGAEYYGWFDQIENGVGIARLFRDEFEKEWAGGVEAGSCRGVGIVTTPIGAWGLAPLDIERTGAALVVSENTLFGPKVNVCGLLPGKAVIAALKSRDGIELALVPSVALDDEGAFIDGLTLKDVAENTGVRVEPVMASGAGLAGALKRI
jgi:putative radical SAM enzyme (TIGR03279 family)